MSGAHAVPRWQARKKAHLLSQMVGRTALRGPGVRVVQAHAAAIQVAAAVVHQRAGGVGAGEDARLRR